jgi:two-component system, OmpR family, sensor histidine kinase KdpD
MTAESPNRDAAADSTTANAPSSFGNDDQVQHQAIKAIDFLARQETPPLRAGSSPVAYLAAVAAVAACAMFGWLSQTLKLSEANIVMVLLAGVAWVAAYFDRGPAITAAILSVLVFDFFFIHPTFSFRVTDVQYLITLAVMLGIGLLISGLTARFRRQFLRSQQQERRTAQLFQITRELSTLVGAKSLVRSAGVKLGSMFDGEVVLYLRQLDGSLQVAFRSDGFVADQAVSERAVRWVVDSGRAAGRFAEFFPNVTARFAPMIGSQRILGVIEVWPKNPQRFDNPEERQTLDTCASLISLSLERDESLVQAHAANLQMHSEQARNSLLSAVSHDLRTPLAMISVTASSLLEDVAPGAESKREMLETVVEQSYRLARQVDKLLGMARLDSGGLKLNQDWEVLEEILESAQGALSWELQKRTVAISIPADFPMLWVDGDLMERVFVNLLENAVRYTPPGAKIEISAGHSADRAEIVVADDGPGLPTGGESKIFERFFRGRTVVADGQAGIGLGLPICQAIIHLHEGTIRAENGAKGARFVISLPCPPDRQTPTPDKLLAEADS